MFVLQIHTDKVSENLSLSITIDLNNENSGFSQVRKGKQYSNKASH